MATGEGISSPEESVRAVEKKAFGLLKLKKVDRQRSLFEKNRSASYEPVPLSMQPWFRKMCVRFANGERIYEGRAKGLGLYDQEKVVCDHKNCRHRETFHAVEISTSSGHIRKSQIYIFIGSKKRGRVDVIASRGYEVR